MNNPGQLFQGCRADNDARREEGARLVDGWDDPIAGYGGLHGGSVRGRLQSVRRKRRMKVEYIIHSEPTGGYSVEFPYMPGCATDADTIEEAHHNAREVAEGWIECQLEHHPDVPLFEYAPWDWECDAGQRFEMDVAIRAPVVSPSPALAL